MTETPPAPPPATTPPPASSTWWRGLTRAMFRSKKLTTAIASALLVILNDRLHLGVDHETTMEFVAIIGAYVVGQGIADAGKERAKLEATSASNNGAAP